MNTAMHEAAHAVVGILLGEDLVEASILPDDDTHGHAWFADDVPDEYDPGFEARLRVSAIALLAGPCAHAEGCEGDYSAVVTCAMKLSSDGEAASRLIEIWTAEAERMLKENAAKVDAITAELEVRGTPTGADVRTILHAS